MHQLRFELGIGRVDRTHGFQKTEWHARVERLPGEGQLCLIAVRGCATRIFNDLYHETER